MKKNEGLPPIHCVGGVEQDVGLGHVQTFRRFVRRVDFDQVERKGACQENENQPVYFL